MGISAPPETQKPGFCDNFCLRHEPLIQKPGFFALPETGFLRLTLSLTRTLNSETRFLCHLLLPDCLFSKPLRNHLHQRMLGLHRDFSERRDLRDANLTGADLRGINLSNAWLQGTDFSGAYLVGANLEWANLDGGEMIGTNFSGANLKNACLSPASFEGANFSAADLTNVTLYASNLENALLIGANLTNADLEAAVFDGADLTNANLTDAKKFGYHNAIYRNTTMPDGSIRSDDI